MRRELAAVSEIALAGDEGSAEELGPDSIDEHAGGEGILAACDRHRQPAAAAPSLAAAGQRLGILGGENAQKPPLRHRALALDVPAQEHGEVLRLGTVLHDMQRRRR